jgi:hypothetical protein
MHIKTIGLSNWLLINIQRAVFQLYAGRVYKNYRNKGRDVSTIYVFAYRFDTYIKALRCRSFIFASYILSFGK